MKIAIVTDAWAPQANGVVRTLTSTIGKLTERGHSVEVVAPDRFRSLPCPSYPEIRLAMPLPGRVSRILDRFAPDAIHISTEGPLGRIARRHCLRRGLDFTTAYHTQFPAYISRRTHLPERLFWPFITRFHAPAHHIMTATESLRGELRGHGFTRLHTWSRGVDVAQFAQDAPPPVEYDELPRPIQLYVGRIAVEKNLPAFLDAQYPGTKVVVGDGPARASLEKAYPDAVFLGHRTGRDLAGCYAGADVFVFPSRTDTFGLVMIEALACGTPVAAFPVQGPVDIVTDATGALSEDLSRAIDAALYCDARDCLARAREFSWDRATDQFLAGLVTTQPNGHPDASPHASTLAVSGAIS